MTFPSSLGFTKKSAPARALGERGVSVWRSIPVSEFGALGLESHGVLGESGSACGALGLESHGVLGTGDTLLSEGGALG